MEIMKRLVQEEEGQGMVEYALIIGIISIAALAFLPGIGSKIGDIFKKVETVIKTVSTS